MNGTHGELSFEAPQAMAHQPQQMQVQRREEPGLLSIIAGAVSDPTFDIGKLERLIALKERTDEQAQRNAFAAAMSRLQAKLPQIEKHGRIMVGQNVRSTFAKMEDLDAQIRPYLSEEGFAFSYDTRPADRPNEIRIIGTMSHSAGHSEAKQIDMPVETGSMSDQQKRGSTLSHGIRQLLKMHLNLVMKEEDDDGTGEWSKAITEEQARTIEDLMAEVNGNPQVFLKMYGIEKLRDLRAKQYGAAVTALEAKRRTVK